MTGALPISAALDAVDIGIIILDTEQRVVTWNRWMGRHTNREAGATLGHAFCEIFPGMARHRLGVAVAQALRYGMSSVLSQALHTAPLPLYRDGGNNTGDRRIDQMIQVRPLGEDSQRQCLIEIHNVTAAAQREKELRQQARRLEQYGREAEQARDEARAHARQLRQANEALQRARNGALEAAEKHHDFLEQLSTTTVAALERLSASLPAGTLGEGAAEVSGLVQQLQGLSEHVALLNQLKAGRRRVTEDHFQVDLLANAVLARARPEAERRGLMLSLNLGPEVPGVLLGDAGHMEQILTSLMENALAHTRSGQITMTLRSTDDVRVGGVRLLCTVADDSDGIPATARRRIFEPFYQREVSGGADNLSSSLGLAVCRELTHLMGGRIWVESEEGVGARFNVSLPLQRPTAHVRHAPTSRPSKAEVSILEPLEVLLAQDDLINQQLVEQLMVGRGHRVLAVPDPRRTLEALIDHRFDVIMVDAGFLSGEEMEALSKGEGRGYHSAPVIVLLNATEAQGAGHPSRLTLSGPVDIDRLELALANRLPDKTKVNALQVQLT